MRVLLFVVLALIPFLADAQLKAFPGAQGYGTTTVHGSGRHLTPPSTTVYRVTSLADSGAGTLRQCLEASGPRVCVFETSGRIQLNSEVKVKNPYLWVAGQTAPSPGVMVTGHALVLDQVTDVLLQHLEWRAGDTNMTNLTIDDKVVTGDSISIWYAKRVVLDHMSVSWAVDGNLDFWCGDSTSTFCSDVTVQNTIVSEGLGINVHPDTVGGRTTTGNGKPHSTGTLVNPYTKNLSYHHNLLAHNWDRNIQAQSPSNLEFLSNVVYNWGGSVGNRTFMVAHKRTGPIFATLIGNHYKAGPNSSPTAKCLFTESTLDASSRYYLEHNICPSRPTDSGDEWLFSAVPTSYRATVPPLPRLVGAEWAPTTYEHVLANAGARPWDRNTTDVRIINDVRNGTGGKKDCIDKCDGSDVQVPGGWPTKAVNTRTLTLPDPLLGDCDKDGYTNLEEFLFSFQG